jgi:hypothetical protein
MEGSMSERSGYVTLLIEVEIGMDVPCPDDLAKHLSRRLAEWSEGRKPFDVEMLEEGLSSTVAAAVLDSPEYSKKRASVDVHVYDTVRCVSAQPIKDA